jgi:hypothetical protein
VIILEAISNTLYPKGYKKQVGKGINYFCGVSCCIVVLLKGKSVFDHSKFDFMLTSSHQFIVDDTGSQYPGPEGGYRMDGKGNPIVAKQKPLVRCDFCANPKPIWWAAKFLMLKQSLYQPQRSMTARYLVHKLSKHMPERARAEFKEKRQKEESSCNPCPVADAVVDY